MWSDKTSLHISVPVVGEVTKQVAAIDGVKIFYSIGKEDLPAGGSEKENVHIAEVLFLVLIALIAICVLAAKSIQKLNKKTI